MTLCGVALNGPSRSTTTAVFWLERYFVVSNKWQTISPWHRINRLRVRAEYFHIRFPVFKSTMQFWFCVLCGSCPLFCTISIEIQIQIHNGRFTGQICRWQLGHRINWMIYRYGVCMSCHTHTHTAFDTLSTPDVQKAKKLYLQQNTSLSSRCLASPHTLTIVCVTQNFENVIDICIWRSCVMCFVCYIVLWIDMQNHWPSCWTQNARAARPFDTIPFYDAHAYERWTCSRRAIRRF